MPDAVIAGWHINSTGRHSEVRTVSDASGNFTITSQTPVHIGHPEETIINSLEMSAIGYDVATCDATSNPFNLYSGKSFTINKAASFDVLPSPAQYTATVNDPAVKAPNELTLQNFYVTTGTGPVYTHTFTAGRDIAILPVSTTDSYVAQTAEAIFYIDATKGVNCSDVAWYNSASERMAGTGSSKAPPSTGSVQTITINQQQTVNAKTVYLSPESFLLQVYPNPANDKVFVQSAKSINFIALSSVYGNTVTQLNWQGAQQGQIDVSQLAPGSYIIKIMYSDNTTSITQIIKQ